MRLFFRSGPLLALLATAVAVLPVYAVLRPTGLVGPLVLAAAPVAMSVLVWVVELRRARLDADTRTDRTARDLARILERQWTTAARQRGLTDPSPIPVAWKATARPIAPSDGDVAGAATASDPSWAAGTADDIADRWRSIPSGRMVFLGPPGSGKTSLAVLLVCRLLADRGADDPIPVLLDLTGWNSPVDRMADWMAAAISAEYLKGRATAGVEEAARLLADGRVLPVLDGFDELPEANRAAAFRGINEAFGEPGGASLPLVLTSRIAEFEAAVEEAGRPLERAAVVEIAPVTVVQAAAYLPGGEIAARNRWAEVTEALAAEPNSALAEALSTPLNLYLARTAYSHPASDPSAMLSYSAPEAIEEHLLSAYLPAAYSPSPKTAEELRLRPYRPEDASRWLAQLAEHCRRFDTADLGWWQLHRMVRTLRLTVAGVVVVLLIVAPAAMIELAVTGAYDVAVLAVVVALAGVLAPNLSVSEGHDSGRFDDRRPLGGFETPKGPQGILRWAANTSVGMLAFGVLVTVNSAYKLSDRLNLEELDFLLVRSEDGRFVFQSLTGEGAATDILVSASVVAALGAAYALVILLRRLTGRLASPTLVVVRYPDPRRSIRNLRLTALVQAVLLTSVTVVGWFVAREGWNLPLVEIPWSAAMATPFGATFWIIASRLAGTWSFTVACFYLWMARRTPLRLMRFMEDATRRGVLRQTGPVYQFRHVKLQAYLAKAE